MRLRMLTSIAGLHFSLKPGDETEWRDEAEARRLIEAGFAEPVRSVRIETADRPPAAERADVEPSASDKPAKPSKTKRSKTSG